MSGVKGRSGRRSWKVENRDRVRKHVPEALDTILTIMRDPNTPSGVKSDSAWKIIAYDLGLPTTRIDQKTELRHGLSDDALALIASRVQQAQRNLIIQQVAGEAHIEEREETNSPGYLLEGGARRRVKEQKLSTGILSSIEGGQ